MSLFLDVLPQRGWDDLQALCKERGLLGAVDELRQREPKTKMDKQMLQVAEYLLAPEGDET